MNRRGCVACLAATTLALTTPSVAAAHAELRARVVGADGVVLRFSEPVVTAFSWVRVYDASGHRIDRGTTELGTGDRLAPRVARLDRGSYGVVWRVFSDDGHVVNGRFVFHVGPGFPEPSLLALLPASVAAPTGVKSSFAIDRALELGLLLFAVGGIFFFSFVAPGAGVQLGRVLAAAAALLACAAAARLALQASVAAGLPLSELHWATLSALLRTRLGEAVAVRVGAAAALSFIGLVLATRRARATELALSIGPAIGIVLVLTVSGSGHASTSGALAFLADLTHVLGASIWAGGLAFLAIALITAGSDRWAKASELVPQFSRVAVVAVAGLAAGGALDAYQQARDWHGLVTSAYGHLVLVKASLGIYILALGAMNNRWAVPLLRAAVASPTQRRAFAYAVAIELALAAGAVIATILLIGHAPPRSLTR